MDVDITPLTQIQKTVLCLKVIYNAGYPSVLIQEMKRFNKRLLSHVVYYCHRVLSLTWKFEVTGEEDTLALLNTRKGFVYAHLHQQEWALMALWRNIGMNVMISLSSDGDAMARVVEKNGYLVTRGSSSRGGAMGLLKLVKTIKQQNYQHSTSVAIDGPRGPFGVPKKGILTLAKVMNQPLILVSVSANRYWEFSKAWSRTQVPKPFTTIRLRYTHLALQDLQVTSDDEWSELSRRISNELCYFTQTG